MTDGLGEHNALANVETAGRVAKTIADEVVTEMIHQCFERAVRLPRKGPLRFLPGRVGPSGR